MTRGKSVLLACAATAALAAASAQAHDLSERHGPLLGAFLHPLFSLDHALGLFAAGLLAGQQERTTARVATLFLGAGLLGGVVASAGLGFDGSALHLTAVNIVSMLVLGGLVALGAPLPRGIVSALLALFGLSHGFENGGDLPQASSGLLVVLGVAFAGAVLVVPPALLATALTAGWPRVALRVGGSWVAAIGLMMLGLELRDALA